MKILLEKMSKDSSKKYTGFQKRAIIFISVILKKMQYNTILFRCCLQGNDNIIKIIGTSEFPVFLRRRLLKCVQERRGFFVCLFWFFAILTENPLGEKCRLEKEIFFSDKGRIYLLALRKQC